MIRFIEQHLNDMHNTFVLTPCFLTSESMYSGVMEPDGGSMLSGKALQGLLLEGRNNCTGREKYKAIPRVNVRASAAWTYPSWSLGESS